MCRNTKALTLEESGTDSEVNEMDSLVERAEQMEETQLKKMRWAVGLNGLLSIVLAVVILAWAAVSLVPGERLGRGENLPRRRDGPGPPTDHREVHRRTGRRGRGGRVSATAFTILQSIHLDLGPSSPSPPTPDQNARGPVIAGPRAGRHRAERKEYPSCSSRRPPH